MKSRSTVLFVVLLLLAVVSEAEALHLGVVETPGKPTIVTSPAADGTSLTFTITPPEGNQGFVKIVVE